MEILIGLLIIAIGSFGQSSSYVPIKKVQGWAWESFWMVQGLFAWLLFPFLGTLLAIPAGESICALYSLDGVFATIGYGMLWGIGGLTFGLSMRYLGVALGQSVALGTCAGLGTILPAIFADGNIFEGAGFTLLIGTAITLAGIATIGYAGSLHTSTLSSEEKSAAIKDFALGKGLAVALLSGVMSACFAFGLESGATIKDATLALGAKPLFAGLPVILLVTIGGWISNAIYCLYQNFKNKTFSDYSNGGVWLNNVIFCAIAGLLWYSQFFGLEIGKSFLGESPVLLAFSWSILMSLNVIFSNIWGIILKEWRGASTKTTLFLLLGIVLLIFSLIFPNL